MAEYEVHEYRFENVVTIWVGNRTAKKTWHVWLKWWLLSSPAERIIRKREKAQKYCDKLNHKEMYYNHEVEISKR